MSEGTGGAVQAPRSHGPIRSPRDFWGGIALMLLALFALWASSDLPGMRGFAFGPGTAPRMFAYVLLALGAGISLVGILTDGEPLEPFTFAGPLGAALLLLVLIPLNIFSARISHLLPGIAADVVFAAATGITVLILAFVLMRIAPRGPLMITAATIIFGVTVRPLGLVIASYISLVVSAYATEEVRWVETLIWCAVLTAFCSVLFPYGLNLPLQLWPRF
jgi:putative tricarboxylic transport membrane protein